MGVTLHLAIGILGNAASLLLYAAPILTFTRVLIEEKYGGFLCVPYTIALLNCLLYTWYGLPVVSNKWENFPLITINGIGILLEFSFIIIYFRFAPPKTKKMVCLLLIHVVMVFCITPCVSAFALKDHRHRKVLVGCVGLVASVSMYASPLIVVKQVIKTKSVEFMPFYLSLFSFLASLIWMAYGLLGRDLFLASPNLVGCPPGLLQLVVYFVYRNKKILREEDDLEKNGPLQHHEPATITCSCITNSKQ
ncbi:bidirectional sugar transporter SWEET3-like isoform X1 [Papaver somniferum]|uniref:bidirectional sugar transporter SWEET3-like isoform X1 n=1 Tax=Papaver somniferum TaxID=3469 RepID=UPI000E6FB1C3|nr:bidirectional sugar transporter SWEET3-like isoform X1 [Papaver somniferum]